MADYKVPQDVEADDKLIGPFTFRQFIYLIIVAMAIGLAWALGNLFIGLAVIPLPIILFFGALALPLRKDQPMEIYMAAIVSFYLKPRLRKWDADGVESLIEITAPKTVEVQRSKDLSQTEAEQRLNYLSNIVDSQGWSIRGVTGAGPNVNSTAMNTDIFLEAQEAEDILDTNTNVAQNFGHMMAESTERVREEAKQRMVQAGVQQQQAQVQAQAQIQAKEQYDQQLAYQQSLQQVQQAYQQPPQAFQQQQPYYQQPQIQPQPQPIAQAYSPTPKQQAPFTQFTPSGQPAVKFDPYPNFKQSVLQPIGEVKSQPEPQPKPKVAPKTATKAVAKPKTKPSTSGNGASADIINLANNSDLSIKTIAREAERINKKANDDSGEVVISLR